MVDNSDSWLWLGDGILGFTVKWAYLLLENMGTNRSTLDPVDEFVFKRLWKCAAPSKVRAFAWQLLLDCVQIKDNLFKRRLYCLGAGTGHVLGTGTLPQKEYLCIIERKIIQADQLNCVLCSRSIEKADHLFLHCDYAVKVWYEITRWLGFYLVIPPNLSTSFAMWAMCVNHKKEKAGMCLIWNAYIWALWRARNDCVFNNNAVNTDEVAEKIKLLSWQWFIGRLRKGPCLLYEWRWSPVDCMRRWRLQVGVQGGYRLF
jgi:hypothetical protein